jgi:hypothetical protein
MAAICLSTRGSHVGLKSYMAGTCDQGRVVLSSNSRMIEERPDSSSKAGTKQMKYLEAEINRAIDSGLRIEDCGERKAAENF